jgi:predicted permease
MALLAAEVYLPLGVFDQVVNDRFKNKGTGLGDRSNTALVLAGRLREGLSEDAAAARLDALSRQLEAAYPGENKNQVLTISPLSRLSTSTSPQTDGGLGAFAGLLLTLSGVVLVIACLNIANMLLARGNGRRKELALRLALGAARGRVVRQLLTETLALAAAGALLGLVLSYWATRAIAISIAAAMPLPVTFNPTPDRLVLIATVVFAALGAIAAGLGPSLKLSRRDLVSDLKDLEGGAVVRRRLFGVRNVMVIGQVALSLALLTAGGIFAQTAIQASRANPGYAYDRLVLASIDTGLASLPEAEGRTAFRSVLDRIRTSGGVTAATMASTVPFGEEHYGERVERIGGPAGGGADARVSRVIGADYFAALGLQMVRGREFTRTEEESATAPPVAIVDELLAKRLFGDEDPIGQMIRVAERPGAPRDRNLEPMQIVGISPPLRDELLDRGPQPHIFVPFGRHYIAAMHVQARIAPGTTSAQALETLHDAITTVNPRLPVLTLSTMEGVHSKGIELWALKTAARLFAALGGLALLLAVVGVYGVKSYLVSQRTREIGIRMALGATARDVLQLVLRDGLFLTGAGVFVGLPLAALVSLAFTKVFVEVGGFDITVVSVSTAVLILSSIAASLVPARRAARVVPLRALRTE